MARVFRRPLFAVVLRKEIDIVRRFSYNNGMKRRKFGKNTGMLICLVGVLCNLLLSAGKIVAGSLTGLFAILADGFNNLSDCGSGVVTLVSLCIAEKPADRKHPYGHRRAEYIAALITGCFVILLAAELLRESVGGIFRGTATVVPWQIYLVLGLSIAVKLGMFALYRVFAKKGGSDALGAAATDSLCDCLATLAAIAGAGLSALFPSADGWAGTVVSLFILWQGVKILIDASSKLLGQAPDPALAECIKQLFLATDGILGVHDLQIYGYGKGAFYATIHAEMDARLTMLDAHTVIDGLERRVKKETGVQLTVHLDPVDLSNREESSLRIKMTEAVHKLADDAELHDFRLLPGTNKVEFDVGVPYACKRSDEELERALTEIVTSFGDYQSIIRIERE